MTALCYLDLLGLPFARGGRSPATGVDCAWVVLRILEAHGITATEADLGICDRYSALDLGPARWERLGDSPSSARLAGDVIVQDPTGQGLGSHLAVLPLTGARFALTACERRGVVCMPLGLLRGVLGVYRLRSAAPSGDSCL